MEGYCEGDELNDRFAASRHPAILARNYLQIRSNLDTNRVGTSDRTILISAIRQWRFFFMGLILRLSPAKRADPLLSGESHVNPGLPFCNQKQTHDVGGWANRYYIFLLVERSLDHLLAKSQRSIARGVVRSSSSVSLWHCQMDH